MQNQKIKDCVTTMLSYCSNGDAATFDKENAEIICGQWVSNAVDTFTGKDIVFEQFRLCGKLHICSYVTKPGIKI